MVTVHEVEAVDPVSVQVDAPSVPVPSVDQLTLPVGGILAPVSVSVTVTVQVDAVPTRTGVSQLTDVVVDRLAVWTVASPPLVRCFWSATYEAAIVSAPVLLRVEVTEHVATAPEPPRVQLVEERADSPVRVQATVPVGVTAVPVSVSVTVAVHVAATPTGTGVSQETDVEVSRPLAVIDDDPEVPACCALPA